MPSGPEQWRWLLSEAGCALRERALSLPDPVHPGVAEVAGLRTLGSAEEVAAALELAAARREAARKFSEAGGLVGDRDGVEQASNERIARYKASRFLRASPERVLDLCSGIGGDLRELARALGRDRVLGREADPARAFMAAQNSGAEVEIGPVEDLLLRPWPAGTRFHLDPARRRPREGGVRGERARGLEEYEPPLPVIRRLVEHAQDGAVKLGPGADLQAVQDLGEVEVAGSPRGLWQTIVWCGRLAGGAPRRATRFLEARRTGAPEPFETFAATPAPVEEDLAQEGRFLLVPDPALERAGLVGALLATLRLAVRFLAPNLGYHLAATAPRTSWITSYPVLDLDTWHERRVARRLRELGAGLVTVHTRDGAAPTDELARRLRGTGPYPLHLFVLRTGQRLIAIIAGAPGAAP
jgi:hypothetical protein